MSAFLILFLACSIALADTTTVVLDPRLNGRSDVYALAFRNLGTTYEAWLTLATTSRDDGRRVLALSNCTQQGFTTPAVIGSQALNDTVAAYNGVPSFHACDPTRAVFVSDRPVPGSARRSNDLYLAKQQADNSWTAQRLPFNTDAWEDTPAFGIKNTTLYFASDRRRPGSGVADLYMATYNGQSWSEPVLLQSICSANDHEASPFVVGTTLYFSSNKDGDQDIYTVELEPSTGLPRGAAKPLLTAGVNMKGANEYHPVVTPGGQFIMFSSDRIVDGMRQYRLYYRKLDNRKDPVIGLRVTARTLVRDPEKIRFFGRLDSIYSVRSSIRIRELGSGAEFTRVTDVDGYTRWKLDIAASTATPGMDMPTRTYVVQAATVPRGFVSSIDTIVVGTGSCGRDLEHTIYLIDTTERRKTCEFTFRTFNVPFFVTTYWCPTTKKYKDYTPCTSLFTDDVPCENLEQPEHCETNEAYRYEFQPARLIRTRRGAENCVNYNELVDSGAVWSAMVDRTIEHMRDEVRSALLDQCVTTAIEAGLRVEITYVGTTDDRSIHPNCTYTGRDFDEVHALAPHIQVDSAIVPYIKNGQHYNRGGYGGMAGGNQLLSDLRSMYFAILFDNLCRETIPLYRAYQDKGMLVVRSRGQAIDQRDLPYSLKRAAGVEIRVPQYSKRFAGLKPPAGKSVVLCNENVCE